MKVNSDVVIVGGGVVGVTSAMYLLEKGYSVTIVEKNKDVGDGVSYGNNALILPSMAGPLATPGLPGDLLKYIGDEHSPFSFKLSSLIAMTPWGVKFLAHCRKSVCDKNTELLTRMCLLSQIKLKEMTEKYRLKYDRSVSGSLRVFRDVNGLNSAMGGIQALDRLGIRYQLLQEDEIVPMEPSLSESAVDLRGGIYYPDDESGDSRLYTKSLAEVLRKQGVQILCDMEATALLKQQGKITGVRTRKGDIEAKNVIISTAFVPGSLKHDAELKRADIYPVKGYSFTVQLPHGQQGPMIPVIEDKRKIGVTTLGSRLRVSSRAEFRGMDHSVDNAVLERMHRYFIELFPQFAEAPIIDRWSGLRPVTPSSVPYISKTQTQGLYLNMGHGHLGWTLANASGALLADLVAGDTASMNLASFALRD